MNLSTAAICFVVCHGGPADHFAQFANHLTEKGHKVEILASGPALDKLKNREVTPFEKNNLSFVVEKCRQCSVVITDVGDSFNIDLQKALQSIHSIQRIAYYDNPESYVPEYSERAAQVMELAQRVWFANAHLATSPVYKTKNQELDLSYDRRVGIGYFPTLIQAKTLKEQREKQKDALRAEFLQGHKVDQPPEKLWVYFGGNNPVYFGQAFPAFLKFLEGAAGQKDLSNLLVVIQQHPGAKEKNTERKQIEEWEKSPTWPTLIFSEWSSDKIAAIADQALYHQTSMGPLFALAGLPAAQVGHEPYEDILVRNKIAPSITSADGLLNLWNNPIPTPANAEELIKKDLGIEEDWTKNLEQAVLTRG